MITITIITTTTAATAPAIIPIGGPSGTTREYIVRHGDSTKVQDQRKLCTMYEIALT
jgi:hypothetical protein